MLCSHQRVVCVFIATLVCMTLALCMTHAVPSCVHDTWGTTLAHAHVHPAPSCVHATWGATLTHAFVHTTLLHVHTYYIIATLVRRNRQKRCSMGCCPYYDHHVKIGLMDTINGYSTFLFCIIALANLFQLPYHSRGFFPFPPFPDLRLKYVTNIVTNVENGADSLNPEP